MDAYTAWLEICNWFAALVTEGMMTDDFPDYDWAGCYAEGDTPRRAVLGAVTRYELRNSLD